MAMTHVAVGAVLALASCVSAEAQDAAATASSGIESMRCDQRDISSDLREVCDGLAESTRKVMARPYEGPGPARAAPLPSLAKSQLISTVTGYGLSGVPVRRDPFITAPDRGVSLRLSAASVPIQFATQFVQPGDPTGNSYVDWELTAQKGAGIAQSGTYMGGAAAGIYDSSGSSENANLFAGVREVLQPLKNFRVGSEITPRVSFAGNAAALTIEPKLTTSSEFQRIGGSDFQGSLTADLGYSVPLEGEPSAYGSFRLTLRPR